MEGRKINRIIVSKDGKIRSALLNTSSGQILRRPLNLLFSIELSGAIVSDSLLEKDRQSKTNKCETSVSRLQRKAAAKARKLVQNMI